MVIFLRMAKGRWLKFDKKPSQTRTPEGRGQKNQRHNHENDNTQCCGKVRQNSTEHRPGKKVPDDRTRLVMMYSEDTVRQREADLILHRHSRFYITVDDAEDLAERRWQGQINPRLAEKIEKSDLF